MKNIKASLRYSTNLLSKSGADLGGKGGRPPPPSGIRLPANPKGPPLVLFKKSFFGRPTLKLALFPFPPTSHDHQFYGVTSGFTRLNMKTKCVWQILISPHVNFHNDRTM